MKDKKFIALAAVLVVGITGTGYYMMQNGQDHALTKEEITATDKSESLQSLYELAYEGVPMAMGKLAREFYDGVNVKRNDEKAFYWAKKGHELNDDVATLILARMYFYGESTQADPQKAIALLNSIKDRKLEVRYILGKMYLDQAKNDPSYFEKGLAEIRTAADDGLAQAQYDLATSLRVGASADKSKEVNKSAIFKQSAEYLAMAAAQGYTPAMRLLGLYFYNGVGVAKNTERGLKLLEEAADNGDLDSIEILEKQEFTIKGLADG